MSLLERILALRTVDRDEFILACRNAVSMVENERQQEIAKAAFDATMRKILEVNYEGRTLH